MKILLLDLNNIIYMCMPMHTHEELLNGGWNIVSQFIVTVNSYLKIHKPDVVFCLGDGRPNWRYELLGNYKESRQKKKYEPNPLFDQLKRNRKKINQILKKLPVYFISHTDLEADDLSYIVSKYLYENIKNVNITALTSDQDWIQLYNYFDNIEVYNQIKKKKVEPFHVNIVNYKCLVGDPSDSIKGMKGIGKKTAEKILKDEDSFYEWYHNLDIKNQLLFKTLRNIISWKYIPKQFISEVNDMIFNYEFRKKISYGEFDEIIDELKLKVYNSKNIVDNFNNLKEI